LPLAYLVDFPADGGAVNVAMSGNEANRGQDGGESLHCGGFAARGLEYGNT